MDINRIAPAVFVVALLACGTQAPASDLSEEQALELISPHLTSLMPQKYEQYVQIELSASPQLWSPAFLAGIEHCWTRLEDGSYPPLPTHQDYITAGYAPLKDRPHVYVNGSTEHVGTECREFIKGAWLWENEGRYLPQTIFVTAYKLEFDGVTSVLSRQGEAKVIVAFMWKPTEFINRLSKLDPKIVAEAPRVVPASGMPAGPAGWTELPPVSDGTNMNWDTDYSPADPTRPVTKNVFLIEYDQGWKVTQYE